MIDFMVIVKIAGLFLIVTGVIIFFLHRTLIASTEGAVNRLNEEINNAQKKQAELNQKIREANEELAKRKAEAKALVDKMRADTEHEARTEREKIIKQARAEGEEIIDKAQGAAEKLQAEVMKNMDSKGVDFGLQILNTVLSDKAKGAFNRQLIEEFLESLKGVDMTRMGSDISHVELVGIENVDPQSKTQLNQLLKQKLNREVPLKESIEKNLAGGIVVKFGSMAVDGSLRNMLREEGKKLKNKIENS